MVSSISYWIKFDENVFKRHVEHFSSSLGIERPQFSKLMRYVLIRHDIVHMGGKTKDGKIVNVSEDEFVEAGDAIGDFVELIEKDIDKVLHDLEL